MNVRKRGLALLMCICMIFTLLPFSAFADGEKPYKTHSDKNGVVMDKTVTHDSDDTYKVTLEQYVKGSVTPVFRQVRASSSAGMSMQMR